jgi:hypothetical protein
MDEQLDRKQLQRKLELCRRLSEIACDPATSSRLAKLVEELEHSLQEAEIQPQIRTQTQSRWTYGP